MTLNYNTRLQTTRYEVPGVIGATFSYYADGRVHRSTDLIDRSFDRAYAYDHMGRLSEALSGHEAGTGSALLGPYRQQYQYDVWSNMKVRSGRLWSGFEDVYSSNYVNDWNTAWTYDEAGNARTLEGVQNTFDVAGRLNRTISPSRRVGTQVMNITLDNRFDGDGLLVKQSTNGTAKYFVRSSVMGGKEIAEADSTGGKLVEYVCANGQVVARQQNGSVLWQHYNPTSVGERQTNSSGAGAGGAEYDPLHSSVGLFDPGPLPGPSGDGTSSDLLFPLSGDATDLSGGCTIDWMAVPCSLAMGVVNRDAGIETDPHRTPSVRWNQNLNNGQGGFDVFKAFADGHFGYLPINARYIGGGRYALPNSQRPALGGYGGNPSNRSRWASTPDPGDGDIQQAAGQGQTRQPCTVNISITNNANLTGEQLTIMQGEIRRIFDAAGQPVVFNQAAANGGTYYLTVQQLGHPTSTTATGWTNADRSRNIVYNVGFASTDVLIKSIQDDSDSSLKALGTHPKNVAIGLGRVAAHEAGHNLLQLTGHTNQGLMQSGFRGRQWWQAGYKDTFKFTREQAQQLSRRCDIFRMLPHVLPRL